MSLPAQTSAGAGPALARSLTIGERTIIGLAAILLVAWSGHLWPQWLHNPDLSHGLFTPLVFAILVHEARTRGTRRYLRPTKRVVAAVCALGIAGLTFLFGAGLYAAALEWNHSLVEFVLASALCCFLTALWLTFSLEGIRLCPFNWPAAVAVAVWILSAPIPPGTYMRLTHSLQSGVTSAVLFTLQLIGVAAFQEGTVIHLAHTSVGVEEACSGVRSLISCVFAGFFLSAVLVRGASKRTFIILLSAPLAIAMNFLRSLLLTLLANAGVEIHGTWHDLTGFAVLGTTAAALAGVGLLLERRESRIPTHVSMRPLQSISANGVMARRLLLASLLGALCLLIVFVAFTRPSSKHNESAPNLLALLPDQIPGWQVTTRDDLYRFTSQLQTNTLAERTYLRDDERGPIQLTVYLAYWPAGQASVSLVASHTPDACWPGSGWTEDPAAHRSIELAVAGKALPEAQYRSFRLKDYPQHVWYWHLVEGKPFHQDVGSPRELLSLAWHYGFRDEEPQVFARISSNRPWDQLEHEPLVEEIVGRLRAIGL